MDTVTLVENQIDEGQWLIDQLQQDGVIIRAACWIKPVEEDRWSLYLATPIVDERGPLEAYRQVIPTLRALGDDWITSSEIMLVGETHSMVKDAIEILRRFPHSKPIHSPRSMVGGIAAEEVYVYPLKKTKVTIYHLVYPDAPSDVTGTLSLEEFSGGHYSLEVGGQGGVKRYQGSTDIHGYVVAPDGAKLETNKSEQMVLAWNLRGNPRLSDANEVWSLANLGLHGFGFHREPVSTPSPR
jgi:hypothetical protein